MAETTHDVESMSICGPTRSPAVHFMKTGLDH